MMLRLGTEHEFIDGVEHKWCNKCSTLKLLDEFGLRNASPDKLNTRCKKCNRECDRKRYAENSELVREADRRCYAKHKKARRKGSLQWAKNNPDKVCATEARRRAHKLGNINEPYINSEIYERDKGICFICDKHVNKSGKDKYIIEHFITGSKGGANADWNVRVAHKVCNSHKYNHVPSMDDLSEWCNYLATWDDANP